MNFKPLMLAASAASLLALPAHALTITVNNASFETLGGPLNNSQGVAVWSTAAIPDWSSALVSGYAIGQQNLNGYAGNPPSSDGQIHAYIEGEGALWQDVTTAVAGTTYTLQVDVMDRTDAAMLGRVNLRVGGSTVATAPVLSAGDGTWNTHTVSWTALAGDAGKTVTVYLTSTGSQGDFDNVRMTAAVPEAQTYAMMLAGLGALAMVSRRRRSR